MTKKNVTLKSFHRANKIGLDFNSQIKVSQCIS